MTASVKKRGVTCPHCDRQAVTYSSRRLSATVVEKYHACKNSECGHVFVSQTGIVRSIVASLTPNAEVAIPLVARRANDIVVTPAAETPALPIPPLHTVIDQAAGDATSPSAFH